MYNIWTYQSRGDTHLHLDYHCCPSVYKSDGPTESSRHLIPLAKMPQVQQSAIKSTGSNAERRPLRTARSSDEDVRMASPPPASPPRVLQARRNTTRGRVAPRSQTQNPHSDVSNLIFNLHIFNFWQWCYSCLDGGDLIICDLCARAICMDRCIKFDLKFEELDPYKFVCPSCHNDYSRVSKTMSPYFVISFHLSLTRLNLS